MVAAVFLRPFTLSSLDLVLSFWCRLASQEDRKPFDHKIKMMTAAAPPPAVVLQKMAEEGIEATPPEQTLA